MLLLAKTIKKLTKRVRRIRPTHVIIRMSPIAPPPTYKARLSGSCGVEERSRDVVRRSCVVVRSAGVTGAEKM